MPHDTLTKITTETKIHSDSIYIEQKALSFTVVMQNS